MLQTLTRRQRQLFALMALGLSTSEQMAERLGEPVSPEEVTELVELMRARDPAEAVRRAIMPLQLDLPEELVPAVNAMRRVLLSLPQPLRWLLLGFIEGGTTEDLLAAVGARSIQDATLLGQWAGAHCERLTKDEVTFLVHALRGHSTQGCARDCDIGGRTLSQLDDLRTDLCRKLSATDVPTAVLLARRSGQLPAMREHAGRVARAQERGFDERELETVRAFAAGLSQERVARLFGCNTKRVQALLYRMYQELDLLTFESAQARLTILLYIVDEAGHPERVAPPEPLISARQLVVLHYLALGFRPSASRRHCGASSARPSGTSPNCTRSSIRPTPGRRSGVPPKPACSSSSVPSDGRWSALRTSLRGGASARSWPSW